MMDKDGGGRAQLFTVEKMSRTRFWCVRGKDLTATQVLETRSNPNTLNNVAVVWGRERKRQVLQNPKV